MQFLGSCEICGKVSRNYRSLALHLRKNPDDAHRALLERWQIWRSQYRAVLRCRKCGGLWDSTDPSSKDAKRCPKCEVLRSSMSKRQYEALSFDKVPDVRRPASRNSKASWDGLSNRSLSWAPGDDVYQAVLASAVAEEPVRVALSRIGVSYAIRRAILIHALGSEGLAHLNNAIKVRVGRANVSKAHARFEAMTPDERTAWMKSKFGGVCALEARFAEQLRARGLNALELDVWQTLPLRGRMVPRQADIKLAVGDGRKIVILCDGEAFHGPRTIYGNPSERIEADRETALAFFGIGYSVARYSETEIQDGRASEHLHTMVARLTDCQRIYRNWCPAEEHTL